MAEDSELQGAIFAGLKSAFSCRGNGGVRCSALHAVTVIQSPLKVSWPQGHILGIELR
jgi:hypothetical protein